MRTGLLAAALAVMASCASPTGPFAKLPYSPGVYAVEMMSVSQQCSGWPTSQVGTSAIFLAELSQNGAEWVARPTNSDQGNFEFVLRPTAAVATSSFTYFEGTFGGSAIDAHRPSPTMPPATFRVAQVTPPGGPAVRIEGAISLSGQFSQAEIQGAVEFRRSGESTVCPAGTVRMSFQRAP